MQLTAQMDLWLKIQQVESSIAFELSKGSERPEEWGAPTDEKMIFNPDKPIEDISYVYLAKGDSLIFPEYQERDHPYEFMMAIFPGCFILEEGKDD